ncbi:uncharacterized protein LOC127000622 isoform X2 [Eriocheir sinensis]|uniref:uncharacterized protein LOC127000622 isoform X2 n=1 Tax=Eriocheir sinensis TaxID=95602 RepID=UPI0021C5730F|nr:uncharacterized protein LOC127000622 isoform X2 [Eriocheir sinensis]
MGGIPVCGHCTVWSNFLHLARCLECCFTSLTRGFLHLGGRLECCFTSLTRGFLHLGGHLACSFIIIFSGKYLFEISLPFFVAVNIIVFQFISIITRGFPQLGGRLLCSFIIIINGKYLFEVSLPFFVVVVIAVFHFVSVIFIFDREYLLEVSLPLFVVFIIAVFHQFVSITVTFVSLSLDPRVRASCLPFKEPFRTWDWLIGLQEGDFFFVYVQEERVRAATPQQLAEKFFQVSAGHAFPAAAQRHADFDLHVAGTWLAAAPEEVLQVQQGVGRGVAGRLLEGEDGHLPRGGSPAPSPQLEAERHLGGARPGAGAASHEARAGNNASDLLFAQDFAEHLECYVWCSVQ